MARNLFNSIKATRPRRNVFDLSHDVKMSMNMGDLVPTLCLECVPGDSFKLSGENMIRFAPMIAPIMHRVDVTMHYFFIPNRLVWKSFEKYITNTMVDGNLPAFPVVQYDTVGNNYTKLWDYLGLPPQPDGVSSSQLVSAIPFAAYQMVYNEYYRDQNLQAPVEFDLIDGDNSYGTDLFVLRKRAWEHDYFTSALPFAQKGAAVDLPLGEFNNVPVKVQEPEIGSPFVFDGTSGGSPVSAFADRGNSGNPDVDYTELYANTEDLIGEATTINDLRRAFRLQEWLEKAARGGSRYIENILMHFGVRSSDARLNRPEYICGVKTPVTISEVLNTTGQIAEGQGAPQGNMSGHGISVGSGRVGSYFCEEHGYIIGVMSVMPKTAYQQGIPKHFLKFNDPFEFYWPSFAHIGEQEVKQEELYAFGSLQGQTFGYVPRYAEYKFMNGRVAGDFRDTLAFWHMGRIFENEPVLNGAFVSSNPTDRIFAVQGDVDHLWCHVFHNIKAIRPMPKFGTPQF